MGKLERLKDRQPIREKRQCNLRIDDDVREMIEKLKEKKDILEHLRQHVAKEVRDLYTEFTQSKR